MRVSVEKPGSPEEVLVHFGKKGMRWGVRSKRTRNFRAKNTTNKERTAAIQVARANLNLQSARYKAQKNESKKINLKKAYLKNPDRVTALRMTRGEKVVNGMILGILAPTPTLGLLGLGVVGGQVAARRRIERKQSRKAYG